MARRMSSGTCRAPGQQLQWANRGVPAPATSFIAAILGYEEKEPPGRSPDGSFPQLPVLDRFHCLISARPRAGFGL